MSLIDKAEEIAKEVLQEVESAAKDAVEFVEGMFSDQGGLESSEGNANLDGEQAAAGSGNEPAASSDSTEQSGQTAPSTGATPAA